MLFNSIEFAIFLPVVFLLYWFVFSRSAKWQNVCPIVSPISIPQNFETKAYAAINNDEAIRMQSSSGGVFHALAKWTIEQGGVVFGARFDDNWEIMHDYTETIEGIEPFMRSKYVQSRVGKTYKQAKKFLDAGRWVLYSGTPCQLGGLQSYLGKDYSKLIQIDLICHGVPSPGVWKKYLKDYHNKTRLTDINFKDKSTGWHKSSFSFINDNQKSLQVFMKNPFCYGFLKDVFLRECCYNCTYRRIHRPTDLSIGDF